MKKNSNQCFPTKSWASTHILHHLLQAVGVQLRGGPLPKSVEALIGGLHLFRWLLPVLERLGDGQRKAEVLHRADVHRPLRRHHLLSVRLQEFRQAKAAVLQLGDQRRLPLDDGDGLEADGRLKRRK